MWKLVEVELPNVDAKVVENFGCAGEDVNAGKGNKSPEQVVILQDVEIGEGSDTLVMSMVVVDKVESELNASMFAAVVTGNQVLFSQEKGWDVNMEIPKHAETARFASRAAENAPQKRESRKTVFYYADAHRDGRSLDGE